MRSQKRYKGDEQMKSATVDGKKVFFEGNIIDKSSSPIYIPENEVGIDEGYYTNSGIVTLLRMHKNEPETIQFIADMLEE